MDPFTKLIDCENDFANSEVLLYNLADDSLFFELNSLDKESILILFIPMIWNHYIKEFLIKTK